MSAAKNTSITVEEHRALLSAKDAIIAAKDDAIAEKEAVIAAKEKRILLLEELVRLQNQKRFGASSEKFSDQQDMFNEAELTDAVEHMLAEEAAEPHQSNEKPASTETAAQTKPGCKPLPAELPRTRIEHDLPDSEKHCHCGCEKHLIGEDTSEQLDIIPTRIQIIVNVRKKYACKQCEGEIATATLPAQPIPKSNATPGTLAHIAISKYQDALPRYRQEAMLQRNGIDIPSNTLANWMIRSGELIQPLINVLQDHQLNYPVLHCDETRIRVLKEPGKNPTSQSYMWVRVGGPPTQPVRLFNYSDTRSGDFAHTLLGDFYERHAQCYLQTDDYAGYNKISSENNITQLGCWAHARRKFIDAQTAKKDKQTGKADMAVNLIRKLYAIEQQIRHTSAEEKYKARQDKAKPILTKIKEWLDKTLHTTVPKGLLGKALNYLNNNWDKLTVYTEDGRLNIDNNPAENAIRPFVIGRKNWLFSATVQGAKSSANLYSLIETAKANHLEPYSYLKHIFRELPKAQTVEAIEQLLPWNVKMEDGVG